jgi:hypothetical protein
MIRSFQGKQHRFRSYLELIQFTGTIAKNAIQTSTLT